MIGRYDEVMERMRNALINNALSMADGNKTTAARLLGMKRTRFLMLLKKQNEDFIKGLRAREAVELMK
jgi:DNA-binding NtrC family response regulator